MTMENVIGNTIANLKIATLIVGVIDIGFLGHSFYTIGKEEAYLSAVIICFIISFLCTMAIIVGLLNMENNDTLTKADMLYHMVACLFYLITLIIFFVSLVDIGNKGGNPLWERVIAFILGVINTILYGLIGWFYFKK